MRLSKPLRYKAVFILIAAFSLSACNMKDDIFQSNSDCSSKEAQDVLKNIIKTESEKAITGNDGMDISKARATLEQIKITIDNVRTTKQDPDSTKKFCTGSIKLSVPSELYNNIEKAFVLIKNPGTLKDAFQREGFEVNANVLSKNADYTTQPTDDKKQLFVELENGKAISAAVRDILILDQMKSKLEAKAAEEKAQEAANTEAQIAATKADFDNALRENSDARKSINAAWNALPKDQQSEMLAEQKAWVAQKTAQCGVIDERKADAVDFNNAETASKAIGKLNCDTNMTNQRLEFFVN